MSRLNSHFEDIEGGILIRTVLDVEKGALYYYWVTPRDFLIGVSHPSRRLQQVSVVAVSVRIS